MGINRYIEKINIKSKVFSPWVKYIIQINRGMIMFFRNIFLNELA